MLSATPALFFFCLVMPTLGFGTLGGSFSPLFLFGLIVTSDLCSIPKSPAFESTNSGYGVATVFVTSPFPKSDMLFKCVLPIFKEVPDHGVGADPIFWTTRDGTLIAADWAEGFLRAIMLRMDAWDRLLKSKRDGQLLIPILALCGDENGESLLGLPPEDEDRVMQEAVEFVAAGGRGPRHAGGGRVRPGVRHRDRRLLAQKRTEANLDAAHARPIVRSPPILKQSRSQRSVPLRVRQQVQEMLRQGRLKKTSPGPPRFSPDAYGATAGEARPSRHGDLATSKSDALSKS
jgi:hypothetical protein